VYTDQLPAADLDYLGWLEDVWVVEEFEAMIAAEQPKACRTRTTGTVEAEPVRPGRMPRRGGRTTPPPGGITAPRVPGHQRSPPGRCQ
jgi:hypothetical protein